LQKENNAHIVQAWQAIEQVTDTECTLLLITQLTLLLVEKNTQLSRNPAKGR
jgi:hypothetical protein